jgi:hypothetical protein
VRKLEIKNELEIKEENSSAEETSNEEKPKKKNEGKITQKNVQTKWGEALKRKRQQKN